MIKECIWARLRVSRLILHLSTLEFGPKDPYIYLDLKFVTYGIVGLIVVHLIFHRIAVILVLLYYFQTLREVFLYAPNSAMFINWYYNWYITFFFITLNLFQADTLSYLDWGYFGWLKQFGFASDHEFQLSC